MSISKRKDIEIRAVVEKKVGAGEADGECLAGYCVYQSYYEAFVWVSQIIEGLSETI